MSEPTCRTCYAQTLSKDERERFFAAPITSSVYYCPEHLKAHDDLMARVNWSLFRVNYPPEQAATS